MRIDTTQIQNHLKNRENVRIIVLVTVLLLFFL
jgi:hypothetical protein